MERKKTNREKHEKAQKEFLENIDENSKAYKEVNKILTPIFDKVLKETQKNHMMVGGMVKVEPKRVLFKPHNFRLYLDFTRSKKYPFKPSETILPEETTCKIVNSKNYSIKNYFDCTIRVKKHTIEIINLIDIKWYSIALTTKAKQDMIKICMIKIEECKTVVKELISLCGGHSNFQITNFKCESKIQGTETLRKLPLNSSFYNRVGKKVYNQPNIELFEPEFASNLIENMAIESIAPKLVHAIGGINPLRFLFREVKSIKDIIKFSSYVNQLTPSEKEDLSDWIIEKFGVKV